MLNILKSRRSIRSYQPGAVTEEQFRDILEAAMYAPSARNLQSWQFIVITDSLSIVRLSEIHPHAKMLPDAGNCLIVCADLGVEPNMGYAVTNCAAATQNALLAIHALGLGGVWLGVYPREERMQVIGDFLQLPSHIMPFSMIALGIPESIPPVPDRFRPDRIHYGKFGGSI